RRSLGSKSKRCRHWLQTPAVRPWGASARARPTGAPHCEQNRLSSATTGLARTTDAGSMTGAGGMSTRPAPMPPVRRLVVRVVPVIRRLPCERADPVTRPDPAPSVAAGAAGLGRDAAGATPGAGADLPFAGAAFFAVAAGWPLAPHVPQ